MAYDHELAARVRLLLQSETSTTERAMFGGLAFLVGGRMAVVASRRGGLMVRVDASRASRLVERRGVDVVEMRGKPMRGWLRIDADALRTKRSLARWVDEALAQVRRLPPK